MTTRNEAPFSVMIGGHVVPCERAAFIAVKADMLHVVPREVLRRVTVPKKLPDTVLIAGQRVSLETAAVIAEQADARELTPAQIVREILEEYAAAQRKPRRARARKERRPLVAAWVKRGRS